MSFTANNPFPFAAYTTLVGPSSDISSEVQYPSLDALENTRATQPAIEGAVGSTGDVDFFSEVSLAWCPPSYDELLSGPMFEWLLSPESLGILSQANDTVSTPRLTNKCGSCDEECSPSASGDLDSLEESSQSSVLDMERAPELEAKTLVRTRLQSAVRLTPALPTHHGVARASPAPSAGHSPTHFSVDFSFKSSRTCESEDEDSDSDYAPANHISTRRRRPRSPSSAPPAKRARIATENKAPPKRTQTRASRVGENAQPQIPHPQPTAAGLFRCPFAGCTHMLETQNGIVRHYKNSHFPVPWECPACRVVLKNTSRPDTARLHLKNRCKGDEEDKKRHLDAMIAKSLKLSKK
ncbi:hypothetical protein B0H11DRAFT_1933842 [Mycena galericulata]|nr:hypothetical protein B0H11DRAFT_1933842 [Mycena galericulata]